MTYSGSKLAQARTLLRLGTEADQLLAAHDGIHNMHGSCAAIHGWYSCFKDGLDVDWNGVGRLIVGMRRMAQGQKPFTRHEVTNYTFDEVKDL